MKLQSKYSRIKDGSETLLVVTIPDNEYGEMLQGNPDQNKARAYILNEAGRIEQKRIDIEAYENQVLTEEDFLKVKALAETEANFNKLIVACTDNVAGYRGVQMRLAGGHRISEGMSRSINEIRKNLVPVTQKEIDDCYDTAMTKLGFISKTIYEYDVSRCGHKTWEIERMPVIGMDRDTVLKRLGKK